MTALPVSTVCGCTTAPLVPRQDLGPFSIDNLGRVPYSGWPATRAVAAPAHSVLQLTAPRRLPDSSWLLEPVRRPRGDDPDLWAPNPFSCRVSFCPYLHVCRFHPVDPSTASAPSAPGPRAPPHLSRPLPPRPAHSPSPAPLPRPQPPATPLQVPPRPRPLGPDPRLHLLATAIASVADPRPHLPSPPRAPGCLRRPRAPTALEPPAPSCRGSTSLRLGDGGSHVSRTPARHTAF